MRTSGNPAFVNMEKETERKKIERKFGIAGNGKGPGIRTGGKL